MNRILCLFLTLAGLSIPASAVTYSWLVFSMADGTEVSVASENLSITYENHLLKLFSPTVDQTISLENVKEMHFNAQQSGLNTFLASQGAECDNFQVYDLNGLSLGKFVSMEDMRSVLKSGVYVIKTPNCQMKVIF